MADERIRIEIEVDTNEGKLRSNFKKLEKGAERSGKKAGKEFGDGFSSGAKSGLRALGGIAVAAAAAIGTVFAGREIIGAAIRQEDAINNLNASLKRIGEFSQGASQDLQNFASELQSVTRFGDEAILEQIAFAQGLGATAEQSKQVAAAATDLAAALNIDLNSATRNIARTLGGFAGELGEVIPELKNLNAEQLRSGAAIDLIARKFEGLARAQVRTFGGALEQATNVFGDLLEAIGKFITSSPAIIGVIRGITTLIGNFTNSLSAAAGSGDLFRTSILTLIDIIRVFGPLWFTTFTASARVFKTFVDAVITGGQVLTAVIGTLGEGIGLLAEKLGVDSELAKGLITFGETTREVAEGSVNDLNQQIKSLGDPIDTAPLLESLEIIEGAVLQTQENITGGEDGAAVGEEVEDPIQKATEASASLSTVFSQLGQGFAATEKEIKAGAVRISKAAIQLGQNIKRGIGQGIGAGFGAFGRALVEGENALDAFAGAFLATLGQLMIQQGTAFILQGLGFSVIPGLQANGGTLIAVGAALATFGGVLSAIGGGIGGAPAAGGVGAAGAGGGFAGTGDGEFGATIDQQEEREEPATQIAVNIQGDVLDSEETGTRIVQILNDSFEQDGIVVTNGAFA